MTKTNAEWQSLSDRIWFIAFCVLIGGVVVCAIWDHTYPADAPLDAIIWGAISAIVLAFFVPVVLLVWRDIQRGRSRKEKQNDPR